jgi:DNA-binding XRE family transcriptional regulator
MEKRGDKIDSLEPIIRENCGQALRNIRNKFGKMSLEDLAKIIGVSRSTVMRIEDGRTLPSDEFMNRLKALQLIGISKFKMLSEKNKTKFSMVLEELGEDVDAISKILMSKMIKELLPFGIIAGTGVIEGAAFVSGSICSIPVLTGLAGYGLIKGMKAILKANNLKCTEVDGRWEIERINQNYKEEFCDESDNGN